MRTRGLLQSGRSLDLLQPGDHVCAVYSSDHERRDLIAPYLAAGIRRGERVAYFGRGDSGVVAEYLTEGGLDVDGLQASGQLEFGDAETQYITAGAFQPEPVVEGFRQASERALADGFTGLRAAADLGWLRACAPCLDLCAYEFAVDRLINGARITGLCTFDLNEMDRECATRIAAVHPTRAGRDPGMRTIPVTVSAGSDGAAHLSGEVDLASASLFGFLLEAALVRGDARTVDAGSLGFIDAAGLRELATVSARMTSEGRPVRLAAVTPVMRRSIEALGLDRVLEMDAVDA